MSGAVHKYLGFTLGGDDFLVPITEVVEIVGLLPITPVPGAAASLRGVVSLRDEVVPVVDLRPRFGTDRTDATEPTCIVIVRAGGASAGLLVDRVSEVVGVDPAEIAPVTGLGTHLPGEHLVGIANSASGVRFVLDVDSAIGTGEFVPTST